MFGCRLQLHSSDRMSLKSQPSSARSYCKHSALSLLWQPGTYQTRTTHLQKFFEALFFLAAHASNRLYVEACKCLNKSSIVVISWWILVESSSSWNIPHHIGVTDDSDQFLTSISSGIDYSPGQMPTDLTTKLDLATGWCVRTLERNPPRQQTNHSILICCRQVSSISELISVVMSDAVELWFWLSWPHMNHRTIQW